MGGIDPPGQEQAVQVKMERGGASATTAAAGPAKAAPASAAPASAAPASAAPASAAPPPPPAGANPLFSRDTGEIVRKLAVSIHPSLGPKADRFLALTPAEQGAAFKRAFFSYTPYAIFLLMPLFALLLKLLYLGSGRYYGEHLLFALHSNAFAFMMLGVLLVTPDLPLLTGAMFLWLVFYLPTAMRRVYGGTRVVTALRWIVLMTLHSASILAAILIVMALAIMV